MFIGLRRVVTREVLVSVVALAGCSGRGTTASDEMVGQAIIALAQVPDDAICLEIVAAGSRTATRRFDLAPNEPTERTLQGLPIGEVTFTARAYGSACALVSQGSEPTWASDPVIATLIAGQTTRVDLILHRPGRAVVGVTFEDESPDAGADASPPTCPIDHYADGDVWNGTHDFQNYYAIPLAVGPNGRLHSGFYRGYAFSDDDGKTWTVKDLSAQISPGMPWPHPAVSSDGASVWLFVRGQGTLLSIDGGSNFTSVPALSGMSSFEGGYITVSPYHNQHVLAYASRGDGFGSTAGTVYRSVDGGVTWRNLDAALAAAGGNDAHASSFDPATPDRFWLADMPEGIFETNDGGASFSQVPGSTHSFMSTVARTFDGTHFRLVVTGACSPPTSTVLGQNVWQSSSGDPGSCCPAPLVIADPFDPTATVLHQCHDPDPQNLRYSTNGGVDFSVATWPAGLDQSTSAPPLFLRSAHVDPYHRRTFYALHENQWTILKSTDGGKTWKAVGWLPGRGC